MVAPVHCSVTPQSAFAKQASVPQLPTLLQELLPQSPAAVHLQVPLTQTPAAQGLVALQVAPAQLPWITPVQLSILPQAEPCVQEAAVPLQVPELSVQLPLSHCELLWQWHLPSASQVPAAQLPAVQGAGPQEPAI